MGHISSAHVTSPHISSAYISSPRHASFTRRIASCLLLLSCLPLAGCGNDNGVDQNSFVTLSGKAFLPAGASRVNTVAALDTFQVVDFKRAVAQQVVATGTTDEVGQYLAQILPSKVIAVIVTDTVRVSGLIAAERGANGGSDEFSKDFNGITDVACEAGATAISDGSVSADDFTTDRIANLEAAAATIDAQVNHLDPSAVTAAAARVRQLTDDGAHPPVS